MRRLAVVLLALALVAALPDVAHACPVCFDARDANRQAFILTAGFLTVLPLGMVASVGVWLRRRVKRMESSDQDDHTAE